MISDGAVPYFPISREDALEPLLPAPTARNTPAFQNLVCPLACLDPNCPFLTWEEKCQRLLRESGATLHLLWYLERMHQLAMIVFGLGRDYAPQLKGGWSKLCATMETNLRRKSEQAVQLKRTFAAFDTRLRELVEHAIADLEASGDCLVHPAAETAWALALIPPVFWHSSYGAPYVKGIGELFGEKMGAAAKNSDMGRFLRAGKYESDSIVIDDRFFVSHFVLLGHVLPSLLPRILKREVITTATVTNRFLITKEVALPGGRGRMKMSEIAMPLQAPFRPWTGLTESAMTPSRMTAGAQLAGTGVSPRSVAGQPFATFKVIRDPGTPINMLEPFYEVKVSLPHAAEAKIMTRVKQLENAAGFVMNYLAFVDAIAQLEADSTFRQKAGAFKESYGMATAIADFYGKTALKAATGGGLFSGGVETFAARAGVFGALVEGFLSFHDANTQFELSEAWDPRGLLVGAHVLRGLGALISIGCPPVGAAIFLAGSIGVMALDHDPVAAWVEATPFGNGALQEWCDNPDAAMRAFERVLDKLSGNVPPEFEAPEPLPGGTRASPSGPTDAGFEPPKPESVSEQPAGGVAGGRDAGM